MFFFYVVVVVVKLLAIKVSTYVCAIYKDVRIIEVDYVHLINSFNSYH